MFLQTALFDYWKQNYVIGKVCNVVIFKNKKIDRYFFLYKNVNYRKKHLAACVVASISAQLFPTVFSHRPTNQNC